MNQNTFGGTDTGSHLTIRKRVIGVKDVNIKGGGQGKT